MSKWQDKSDFEINRAVAELKYCDLVVYEQFGSVRVQVSDGDDFNYEPCNNPSDAWPVIQEIWKELTKPVFDQDGNFAAIKWDVKTHETMRGQLRAAMIVYLEMNNE